MAQKNTVKPLISIAQAAELVGITESTAYRWLHRGELPGALFVGNRWLVRRRVLVASDREYPSGRRWTPAARTLNQWVPGSSPGGSTREKIPLRSRPNGAFTCLRPIGPGGDAQSKAWRSSRPRLRPTRYACGCTCCRTDECWHGPEIANEAGGTNNNGSISSGNSAVAGDGFGRRGCSAT